MSIASESPSVGSPATNRRTPGIPTAVCRGRNERGTPATTGKTFPYEPTEDPSKSGSSSGMFLQKVYANGNFIAGVLDQTADELQWI